MQPDPSPLVPLGAAQFPAQLRAQGGAATRSYAFVVLPGFTLLAFAAALDPLRIANQLAQAPLYHWQVLSADGAAVKSSSGLEVSVNGALGPQPRGVTLLVCAGNRAEADQGGAEAQAAAAAQRHFRHGGAVGGICTGAVALARAGLLGGRAFTLHWENQPGFRESFPELSPTPHRYEIDGRVLTCGGGAAATDMMLAQIATDHGRAFAALVSEMCLRHVGPGDDRLQRSSIAMALETRNPALIMIVDIMRANLEAPLGMEALAARAGYSRRQIERMFRAALGQSPARYYAGLRLERARALLAETNLSLPEIAAACGFETQGHFARAFRQRFGCPPSRVAYRGARARGG